MKNLYCILGNSGCGKTTLVNTLHDIYGMSVLPSYTTRPKRKSTDTDHIYITQDEYEKIPNKVATRVRPDGCYCATKEQVDEYDLYVIDFDGLKELYDKYHGEKQLISFYLDVPLKICKQRMLDRGDHIENVEKRTLDSINTNTISKIKKCNYRISGISDKNLLAMTVYGIIQELEKESNQGGEHH